MKRKLFKKALSAVLMAALLMTTNGIASANAADKISVEGVYTNFQKATLATGTTKQIKAYVEPVKATNQNLGYNTADAKVATVDAQGLITAVAPGKTTITVKALDGSGQDETVVVTVLEDLHITKALVDKDNEVVILDNNYGNITVDSSVGDATIYLAGVTVKNLLTLDAGKYTLELIETKLNKVVVEEVEGEISSLSNSKKADGVPQINITDNTSIAELLVLINAKITKGDGTQINNVKVARDERDQIVVTLDGFAGDLLVDASIGDIELVLNNSNLNEVKVIGDAKDNSIVVKNGKESSIVNVVVESSAILELVIPVATLDVTNKASGSSITTKAEIGTINYNTAGSNLDIGGNVAELNVTNGNNTVNVLFGTIVTAVKLDGKSNKVYGNGKVEKVAVNADNNTINITDAVVTVGKDVNNTSVNDYEALPGSKVIVQEPIPGGSGSGSGSSPKDLIGKVIVGNDFENGINNLTNIMGTLNMNIVDGGSNDSNKSLYVTGKTADWNGVGFDLSNFLYKHITVQVKADIQVTEAGNFSGTIVNEKKGGGTGYASVGSVVAEVGKWYPIEGTFELSNLVTSARLYFQSPGQSNYYLDNVVITVVAVGDPVPVTGVTTEKDITVELGSSVTLVASVLPADADNTNVMWFTDNTTIATIRNGSLTGVKLGTTKIKVVTVEGQFIEYATVTVVPPVPLPSRPDVKGTDLSLQKKDLPRGSTVEADKISNSRNGTLNVNDVEIFSLKLPTTVKKGESVTITVKGNCVGDFRFWLIDSNEDTRSNIYKMSEHGFVKGDFEHTVTLTATNDATEFFFKAHAPGGRINGLKLYHVIVHDK